MSKAISTKSPTETYEKISLGEKLAYGGGDLASNLIMVISMTYITFFYTDSLGLNAGIIGTILMIARLFDGISDILMGYVMDKTKSKHGKARPWLLWLAAPMAISTVLMFMVPNTGEVGKYIYIIITYNLVTTFLYTAINIPYGALTALMTRDQDQRMVINIFRMTMAQIGALIINAFTLPLVNALGGSSNQRAWVIVSIMYGLIAMALFLLCFYKTKERVNISATEESTEKVSAKVMFKAMMQNNYWLLLVVVWVVMVFGMAFNGSVSTYYAKYILNNENLAGYLMAISTLPIIIVMPFLTPIIRRFGKRNVAMCGSFVDLLGQLLILLSPTSVGWLMFCFVIRGVGSAALMGTIFAMVADTIEYGHWKTGIRVEGMLYSSTTFGAKVGAGIAGAIAMNMLSFAGYDGLAAIQNENTIAVIRNLYLYVPIVFLAVQTLLYSFYNLDKIYPTVIKELKERETGKE